MKIDLFLNFFSAKIKLNNMKVVINVCYGGFGVSTKVLQLLLERQSDCLGKLSIEQWYGKSKKDWEKDFKEYKKIGDDIYAQKWGHNIYKDGFLYDLKDDCRTNKDLIEIIELLKEDANGSHAKLKIVEIPDGIQWDISEYDGFESVEEQHRSWS